MAEEFAAIEASTTEENGAQHGAVNGSRFMTSLQAKVCVDGLRASLREVARRQEKEQERFLAKFLDEVSGSIGEPSGAAQSGPPKPADFNGKCRDESPAKSDAPTSTMSFLKRPTTSKIGKSARSSGSSEPQVKPPVMSTRASELAQPSNKLTAVKDHESSPAIRTLLEAMKENESKRAREQEKLSKQNCLQRLVTKSWFDGVVGSMIVANIAVMAMELEYDGRMMRDVVFADSAAPWSVPWIRRFFEVVEQLFTFFFAAELALRVGADGLLYLKSFSRAADAFIVVVCSLDSWLFTPVGVEGMSSIVLLRLLRLLRLAKVFRVVRVMRVFHSLRVLVCAIITSVGALLWSMTLLFVIELSSGLLMARLFHSFMLDSSIPQESREWLWMHFGTCLRSFLTMFEITMAPGAFIAYRRIFDDVSPMFTACFIVYVCFVTFAVIRVITAMFLKATLSAHTSEDAEQIRQRELLACTELLSGVNGPSRNYWEAGEEPPVEKAEDSADMICKEDLAELILQPKMKTWLDDLDLSPQQAVWLFNVLDNDGDGRVHFSKYVAALLHMKGNAKSADLTIQFHEIRHLVDRVDKMHRILEGKVKQEDDPRHKPAPAQQPDYAI